jgi:hypothetical protein
VTVLDVEAPVDKFDAPLYTQAESLTLSRSPRVDVPQLVARR